MDGSFDGCLLGEATGDDDGVADGSLVSATGGDELVVFQTESVIFDPASFTVVDGAGVEDLLHPQSSTGVKVGAFVGVPGQRGIG